jgi:hypothetical protein
VYTAPCAAWHTPVFLLNSRLGRFAATDPSAQGEPEYQDRHPFFRSYGIIMPSSLTTFHSFTLGYSPCPPVSVYGTDAIRTPPQAFLAGRLHRTRGSPKLPSCHHLSAHAYRLRRSIHKTAPISFPCPLMGYNAHMAGRECSPSVHRLRLWGLALGSASPCADCHGAGILGLTVCGVFTRICAYSFRHPHFPSLHGLVSTPTSQHGERSPTPVSKKQGQASAGGLIPTILGARTLDW